VTVSSWEAPPNPLHEHRGNPSASGAVPAVRSSHFPTPEEDPIEAAVRVGGEATAETPPARHRSNHRDEAVQIPHHEVGTHTPAESGPTHLPELPPASGRPASYPMAREAVDPPRAPTATTATASRGGGENSTAPNAAAANPNPIPIRILTCSLRAYSRGGPNRAARRGEMLPSRRVLNRSARRTRIKPFFFHGPFDLSSLLF
jgi:hypothetical protein